MAPRESREVKVGQQKLNTLGPSSAFLPSSGFCLLSPLLFPVPYNLSPVPCRFILEKTARLAGLARQRLYAGGWFE